MTLDATVVIPVRDRHELLRRALSSVHAQVGVSLEIIVVDDASDSPVARWTLDGHPGPSKLVRLHEQSNSSFARNVGALRAASSVICFLDSDDYWDPTHVMRSLDALTKENASVVVTSFDTQTRARRHMMAEATQLVDDPYLFKFTQNGPLRSSCLTVDRSLFWSVGGFDEELEKSQDVDFALRAAWSGKLVYVPVRSVFIDSLAPGRMSSRPVVDATDRFLSKHGAWMDPRQRARFLEPTIKSVARSEDGVSLGDLRVLVDRYGASRYLGATAQLALRWPLVFRALDQTRSIGTRLRLVADESTRRGIDTRRVK